MATWQNTDNVRGVVQQWSNATVAGDPASGYTETTGGTVAVNRALTAEETAWLAQIDAANTATVNGQTLRQRAQAALNANSTFQAIGSPSNAQVAAQVQSLTKQCNGIIRLLLDKLDATTGT